MGVGVKIVGVKMRVKVRAGVAVRVGHRARDLTLAKDLAFLRMILGPSLRVEMVGARVGFRVRVRGGVRAGAGSAKDLLRRLLSLFCFLRLPRLLCLPRLVRFRFVRYRPQLLPNRLHVVNRVTVCVSSSCLLPTAYCLLPTA